MGKFHCWILQLCARSSHSAIFIQSERPRDTQHFSLRQRGGTQSGPAADA